VAQKKKVKCLSYMGVLLTEVSSSILSQNSKQVLGGALMQVDKHVGDIRGCLI
jgi:hypothetical protein